jgi:hypothetical protein
LLRIVYHLYCRTGEIKMHILLKIISIFIGLFAIVNGAWIVAKPPFGDEPQGYAIVAAGVFIPLITYYIARINERREA